MSNAVEKRDLAGGWGVDASLEKQGFVQAGPGSGAGEGQGLEERGVEEDYSDELAARAFEEEEEEHDRQFSASLGWVSLKLFGTDHCFVDG